MKNSLIALALTSFAMPALALEPLSGEKGWSGALNLGIGSGGVESNFLARISGIDLDLGDDTIATLDAPDDESITTLAGAFNVGYTFSNGKTRAYLANDLTDFIEFDRSTQLAVRHDFDHYGTLELAAITSVALQTEVWEDPYATDVSRDETEKSYGGARITWDRIWGSGFELIATVRDQEIDEERSGQSLGLSLAEQALLNREGDLVDVELAYLADLGGGHSLRPRAIYVDRDLDGSAMTQDGAGVGITYRMATDAYIWEADLEYVSMDGDAQNPIFDEINDADRTAISTKLLLPGLFGLKDWTPNVGAMWGEVDSDIDFNDSKVWMISIGAFRRF